MLVAKVTLIKVGFGPTVASRQAKCETDKGREISHP